MYQSWTYAKKSECNLKEKKGKKDGPTRIKMFTQFYHKQYSFVGGKISSFFATKYHLLDHFLFAYHIKYYAYQEVSTKCTP